MSIRKVPEVPKVVGNQVVPAHIKVNPSINLEEARIISEYQMKDRIVEELKKAKEAGQVTAEKVSEIVKGAVAAAVAETKGGVQELRPIVKEAVTAAVERIRERI